MRNLTQAQKGYTAKWTERQEEQKRKDREEEERRLAAEEAKRIQAEQEAKRIREEEEERLRKEVSQLANSCKTFWRRFRCLIALT